LPLSTIDEAKHSLAGRMQAVRRAAHRAAGREAAEAICDSFRAARLRGLAIERGWTVSGFWPIRDEIDIRRLLAGLHEEGMPCALPVVRARGEPLIFRRWRPADVLEPGGFGLSQPPSGAPELTPRIVLTPLLAVDSRGNRLGYGGGYYDRTLRRLRGREPVVAVGMAFEAQRIADVPHDGGDEPLDWLVTEKGAYRFGG
jgi:5-formyltetrahydrofolate cyclo-ligase